MAIGDDFEINYSHKLVRHTSGTTVYSVNALYSYLQDTFDEPAQMDDPVPMSAQTPTAYTMINGWFLDDTSPEFLNGGAITTTGWTGGVIRQFPYVPSVDFTAGDIGEVLTGSTTGDTGVIVHFNTACRVVWVRPDDSATDLFDDASEGYSVSGSSTSAGSTTAVSGTGESLWSNMFTLGTLESNTDIYVGQENDRMGGASPATLEKISAWWTTGQIDVLIKVREADVLIDTGSVIVFARQYSKLYDNFGIDLSAGGRNAVPLATGDDLNNTTGIRSASLDAGEGTFTVDEIIEASGTNQRAIVLAASESGASRVLAYYLIGDPLNDFNDNDKISGCTSGASGNQNGAAADFGPATDTDITITFGATGCDINNGAGDRPYSVVIDCNDNLLASVYERTKFITRRGETTAVNGQDGEFYIAIGDALLEIDNSDGNFTETEIVTASVGASGYVTAEHLSPVDTASFLVLRTLKGTFSASDIVTGDSSGTTACVISASRTITPVKAAPFGTFAGGTFFGARGVFLDNVNDTEAQNYQLIDTEGTVQVPPNTVTIAVTGLEVNDRATVFRLDGAAGSIFKTENTMTAQAASIGTITVDAAIPSDTPQAGVVRVVDSSASLEQRYRYASYAGSVFTLLPSITGQADAGGNASLLVDAGVDFTACNIEIGDLVMNDTDAEGVIVASIIDANNIKTTDLTGSWDTSDVYTFHETDRAYTTSDTAYVPLVDEVRTVSGSATNTLIFSSNIPVVVRVRQGLVILPFEVEGTVNDSGLTVAAIRTTDTIASS